MEVFESQRDPDEAVTLTRKLKALGLRGRDAAYIASLHLPRNDDPGALEHYLAEFRFMVSPDKRAEAAALIGLSDW